MPQNPHQDPQQEEIAALARRYYEHEGRPEGRAFEHWLRAERELREARAQATDPDDSSSSDQS